MDYCNLCPRGCKVNRNLLERGACGETSEVRVARASLHYWEEPPISGERGSGTVFFSGCPLHCVFCQNHNIADGTNGEVVTIEELSSIFLHLEDMGAENINLVTPTHFVPQIRAALIMAKRKGLTLPVVYNTSSYEDVETLKLLSGLVDYYLPDLKYMSSELSRKYSSAPDYFEVATKAIDEMVAQVGTENVIIRHLVLPGCIDDSKAVLKFINEKYGDNIFISIMSQYTPLIDVLKSEEKKRNTDYSSLKKKLSREEYDEVLDYACDLGITKAFVQEEDAAKESFIPDFENWTLKDFLAK